MRTVFLKLINSLFWDRRVPECSLKFYWESSRPIGFCIHDGEGACKIRFQLYRIVRLYITFTIPATHSFAQTMRTIV